LEARGGHHKSEFAARRPMVRHDRVEPAGQRRIWPVMERWGPAQVIGRNEQREVFTATDSPESI